MNKPVRPMRALALANATAAAALYVIKRIQAHDEDRSMSSLILEDALKWFPQPDYQIEKNYLTSLKASSQPFLLPKIARLIYGLTEFGDHTDTFVMEPESGMSDYTIFYLHGGCYWSDPNLFYYQFLQKLSNSLRARVILPVYPKAPFYGAGDVHEMILDRYLDLIGPNNTSPDHIILMGDSAGGGLALALLQVLRDRELPQPRQAFLLSPWLDISTENIGMQLIQPLDPLLNIQQLAFQGKEYAKDLDLKDPLVSPLFGSQDDLPPISVITGTRDILFADALKYKLLCDDQALNVAFHVFDKQIHCFMVFPIPESDEAIAIISREIKDLEH